MRSGEYSLQGTELESQVRCDVCDNVLGTMICDSAEDWSFISSALLFSWKSFVMNPVKKKGIQSSLIAE